LQSSDESATASAWRGDWQERISRRLKDRGFASYSAFLDANLGLSYSELAERLAEGDDVVPVQLARLHAMNIDPQERQRAVCDSFARSLRGALKNGWGIGRYWESAISGALASWHVTWGETPDLVQFQKAVLDLKPEPGWLPVSADDPVLLEAARRTWPSDT
jgi:hypothetical protein